jgi:hypothetical protein
MFSYNAAASSSSSLPRRNHPSALEASWGTPYGDYLRDPQFIEATDLNPQQVPRLSPPPPSPSPSPVPRPANPEPTIRPQVARKSVRGGLDVIRVQQIRRLQNKLRTEVLRRKDLEKQVLRIQRLWKVHKSVTLLTARYQEVGIGEIDDLFRQTIPHEVIDLTED